MPSTAASSSLRSLGQARRLAVVLAAALALSACSFGEDGDVPDDQSVRPGEAPAGFEPTDLDVVSVATPPEWEQQPATEPAANIVSTVWRGPLSDGTATAGLDVRVITDPQQPAEDAATALGVSAMAALGGSEAEPVEVVWPGATSAWLLAYDAQVPVAGADPTATPTPSATPDAAKSPPLTTRTLVLDLADGRQLQITALSDAGPELPEQVLSSVTVADDLQEG